MNRRERLREYWEARVPPSAAFYLVDAERVINRGHARKLVALRTLQRRAAEGRLPVLGGSDRAVHAYQVLREDLIEFLLDLDVITGREPPPARARAPARSREEPQPGPPPRRRRPPPPKSRSRGSQTTLFDD